MFSICIDVKIVWVRNAIRKHMNYSTFNVVIFKTLKLHVRRSDTMHWAKFDI